MYVFCKPMNMWNIFLSLCCQQVVWIQLGYTSDWRTQKMCYSKYVSFSYCHRVVIFITIQIYSNNTDIYDTFDMNMLHVLWYFPVEIKVQWLYLGKTFMWLHLCFYLWWRFSTISTHCNWSLEIAKKKLDTTELSGQGHYYYYYDSYSTRNWAIGPTSCSALHAKKLQILKYESAIMKDFDS
jgi:hypothetical protein